MKKLLKRIPRLSRPRRIVRNLICCVLLLVLCWFVMGAEPFLPRWAFRVAERTRLTGPAEILDVVRMERDSGSNLYIAIGEDQWGYSVFGPTRYAKPDIRYTFFYQEKQENVNLMIPDALVVPDEWPIILFTQLPAVRAEISFALGPEILNQQDLQETIPYCLEGEWQEEGYFLFRFSPDTEDEVQRAAEFRVMGSLAYWSNAYNRDIAAERSDAYEITVRLWDSEGNLIYENAIKCGFEVIDNEN